MTRAATSSANASGAPNTGTEVGKTTHTVTVVRSQFRPMVSGPFPISAACVANSLAANRTAPRARDTCSPQMPASTNLLAARGACNDRGTVVCMVSA